MAGSGRAELASNNPDGSAFTYPNGQRGVYSGSNLDRSGSFREGSESRVQVSGAGTSRNSASAVEIPPVSQYLSLEPLSTGEQKYPRSVELRRVLGVNVDEHSFGSVQSKPLPLIAFEDVKRFKTSIEGSSTRAKYYSDLFSLTFLIYGFALFFHDLRNEVLVWPVFWDNFSSFEK